MIQKFYLDDQNNIVSLEESTHFIIQELDDHDNIIKETFGVTKKPWEIENQNQKVGEPTKEMKEILNNIQDKNGNYVFRK